MHRNTWQLSHISYRHHIITGTVRVRPSVFPSAIRSSLTPLAFVTSTMPRKIRFAFWYMRRKICCWYVAVCAASVTRLTGCVTCVCVCGCQLPWIPGATWAARLTTLGSLSLLVCCCKVVAIVRNGQNVCQLGCCMCLVVHFESNPESVVAACVLHLSRQLQPGLAAQRQLFQTHVHRSVMLELATHSRVRDVVRLACLRVGWPGFNSKQVLIPKRHLQTSHVRTAKNTVSMRGYTQHSDVRRTLVRGSFASSIKVSSENSFSLSPMVRT